MKKGTFNIKVGKSLRLSIDEQVTGYIYKKYFGIHLTKSKNQHYDVLPDCKWSVTHLSSGMKIVFAPTLKKAKKCISVLVASGVDWSLWQPKIPKNFDVTINELTKVLELEDEK